MKKTVIDIADLIPEYIIREIRGHLDVYVKELEEKEKEPIVYRIELGTIILEVDLKPLNRHAKIIKSVILKYFDRLADEIYRKGKGARKRELCYLRQLTAYFLDEFTQLSLSEIGKEISGEAIKPYDHATVLHSKRNIENLCDVDKSVRNDVEEIKVLIEEKLRGL